MPKDDEPASRATASRDPVSAADLAGFLDHTLLRPDATPAEVDRLCQEALANGFAAVCVYGVHASRCAGILRGSRVRIACVAGFPHGAAASDVKAYEARRAVEDGAGEVDVVIQIGALRSGDDALVRRDLEGVVLVCHGLGAQVKAILELGLLTDAEKLRALAIAQAAGADFVKTSTGFAGGGATVEDVRLLRRTVGAAMGIKASGGVRTAVEARALIAAGATRIGTSASVAIVRDDAAR